MATGAGGVGSLPPVSSPTLPKQQDPCQNTSPASFLSMLFSIGLSIKAIMLKIRHQEGGSERGRAYPPCSSPSIPSQHSLGNCSVSGLLLLSTHICPTPIPPLGCLQPRLSAYQPPPLRGSGDSDSSTPLLLYSPTPLLLPLSSHSPTNSGIASHETQTRLYHVFSPHSSIGYTLVLNFPSLQGPYTTVKLWFD